MDNDKNPNGGESLENAGIKDDESLTPEQVKELKSTVTNVVDELKALRKKNQELADELASKGETPEPAKQPDDVTKITEVVKQILGQEKESNAKTNKQVAFEKFITENKEFHPSNDPTGLKRQALETKLARFNQDGLYEEKDFYSVIEEASILLGKNDNSSNTTKEVRNPYSSTPSSTASPSSVEVNKLSPKEQKLVDRGSVTKEYLLKVKETKPHYLKRLLEEMGE